MKTFILIVCFLLACFSMAVIFGQCIRINEANLRNPRLAWGALVMLIVTAYTIVSILVPHW